MRACGPVPGRARVRLSLDLVTSRVGRPPIRRSRPLRIAMPEPSTVITGQRTEALEGAGQLAATKLLLHPQGVDECGDGARGADAAQRPPRLGRDRVVLVVGEGEDLGDRLGPADLAQGVEHLDPAGPLGEGVVAQRLDEQRVGGGVPGDDGPGQGLADVEVRLGDEQSHEVGGHRLVGVGAEPQRGALPHRGVVVPRRLQGLVEGSTAHVDRRYRPGATRPTSPRTSPSTARHRR